MLYKQLTHELLDKIGSGQIQVGERLPPEADYAERLGVSRSTLRLAFSQLEDQGIIRRRKRGGTEVIADTPVKKYNMLSGGLLSTLSIGPETMAVITNLQRINGEQVADLAGYRDTSSQWLAFNSTRYLSNEQFAFAFTDAYVPDKYSNLGLQQGDRIHAIYKLIEQRYNIKVGRVKQTVSTKLCFSDAAVCMGLTENEPVLTNLIEIQDTNANVILVAHAYHNPSRISLNSDVQITG